MYMIATLGRRKRANSGFQKDVTKALFIFRVMISLDFVTTMLLDIFRGIILDLLVSGIW